MSQSASRQTAYALLSALEEDLRHLIIDELAHQMPAKDLLGGSLWDRAVDRLARDDSAVAEEPDAEDLLPYCDFGDLAAILNVHRASLPKQAAEALRSVTVVLERLAPIRNRVAHSRPLQIDDLPTVVDATTELRRVGGIPWTGLAATAQRLSADPSFALGITIQAFDRDPSRISHNLPVPDFDETGFVGRGKLAGDLRRAVLSSPFPIISIVGEGGAGKSALALKTAYDVLDTEGAPFDAIVWTTSKTMRLTVSEVVSIEGAIADSLGVIKDIATRLGANESESIEEVLEYLAEFRVLLVLDNLETVLDDRIRAFLERLPTGSKVLITSRIGLGAFEYPVKLGPMEPGESVQLIRAVARARGAGQLVSMPNDKLTAYCQRLKHNPGFIKWFVSVVQTGKRPEDALASPDVFLDFCMSNVYSYLSLSSISLVRVMLSVAGRHSQAELAFLAQLDVLELQKALQQLLTTNFVLMHSVPKGTSFESQYELSDLARTYLAKHHPVPAAQHADTQRLRRQMVAAGEQLRAQQTDNPFDIRCITMRTRSDLVTAKYLVEALTCARAHKLAQADELVAKAKALAPEYFEVHRVEAYVRAKQGDLVSAKTAYEAALELEGRSAPLHLWFGGFLLLEMDDAEGAAQQFLAANSLRPGVADIEVFLVRAYLYSKNFASARPMIDGLLAREDLSAWTRRKCCDLDLQYWQRVAEYKLSQYDNAGSVQALLALRSAYEGIPSGQRDREMKMKIVKARATGLFLATKIGSGPVRSDIESWLDWCRRETGVAHPAPVDKAFRTPTSGRKTGAVSRVRKDLGFGFLKTQDGDELFFHRNSLAPELWLSIASSTAVSYAEGTNAKGRCAVDLRMLE